MSQKLAMGTEIWGTQVRKVEPMYLNFKHLPRFNSALLSRRSRVQVSSVPLEKALVSREETETFLRFQICHFLDYYFNLLEQNIYKWS